MKINLNDRINKITKNIPSPPDIDLPDVLARGKVLLDETSEKSVEVAKNVAEFGKGVASGAMERVAQIKEETLARTEIIKARKDVESEADIFIRAMNQYCDEENDTVRRVAETINYYALGIKKKTGEDAEAIKQFMEEFESDLAKENRIKSTAISLPIRRLENSKIDELYSMAESFYVRIKSMLDDYYCLIEIE